MDDLDRCLPETVVDSLEAMRLFLAVPRMSFVMALLRCQIATQAAKVWLRERLLSDHRYQLIKGCP